MAKRKRRAKKSGPYVEAKKAPLGSGERFAAVAAEAAAGGAKNPEAVAAMAGRKKLGNARFQALAAAGRRRAYSQQRRASSRAHG
jgi:hypothetical protein